MKQLILTGGLGNQMFEFAYFLSCKKKGLPIKLNIDMYNVNRMHNGYMLNRAFGIPWDYVEKSTKLSVFRTRLLRRFHPFGLVFREDPTVYKVDAFYTKRPYIDGIFINEEYFKDIKNDLIKAFDFKDVDTKNKSLAGEMGQCESVSIHIRRGDYLQNPSWCVCKEAYYENAINYIKDHVAEPKFYVFSDDPTWCEGFMKLFNVEFVIVNHNTGLDSYKDMYLMTQCKHNIIANSTFSWWGAWLNSHTDKIVCRPSIWLNEREINPYLREWTKISVQ